MIHLATAITARQATPGVSVLLWVDASSTKSGQSGNVSRATELRSALQTNTSAISGLADANAVPNLPSNGRDWTEVAEIAARSSLAAPEATFPPPV